MRDEPDLRAIPRGQNTECANPRGFRKLSLCYYAPSAGFIPELNAKDHRSLIFLPKSEYISTQKS